MPTRQELAQRGMLEHHARISDDFIVIGRGGPEFIWNEETGKLYHVPEFTYEHSGVVVVILAMLQIIDELVTALPSGARKTALRIAVNRLISRSLKEATVA